MTSQAQSLILEVPDWNHHLDGLSTTMTWPLIPVADKPLAAHWLDWALDAGYTHVQFQLPREDPTFVTWLKEAELWPMGKDCVVLAEDIGEGALRVEGLPGMPLRDSDPEDSWELLRWREELEALRLLHIPEDERVGPGCSIAEETHWEAPYWVGSGVKIEAGTTIGPGSCLGSHSWISAGSTITRSRVDDRLILGSHLKLNGHWAGSGFLVQAGKRVLHQDPDPELLRGIDP